MSYRVRENHKLEVALPLHTPAPYDLSNQTIAACVDGANLVKLSLSGSYDAVLPGGFYGVCGEHAPVDPQTERQMIAYGRVQETRFTQDDIAYTTRWVLGSERPVLFLNISATSISVFSLIYHFGVQCPPERLNLLCTAPLMLREREGDYRHYSVKTDALIEDGVFSAELTLAFDLGCTLTQNELAQARVEANEDADVYFTMLLSTAKREEDTAFQAYALNAAFSSYKSFTVFQGFFAGVNYAVPARTYYRDGYYTALAVLPYRPDWVRAQLVTLARGIADDGSCGSAVDALGAPWWRDHVDSPLFFALLLYAYVVNTADHGILDDLQIGRKLAAILDQTIAALDENGLIPRSPASRHDWADNVFREGYVTYVQCLAFGALQLGGSLLPERERYREAAQRIKTGVNQILWDETLGYYVNFKTAEETERNLSIDTVFAALFELAPADRAKRMLTQMEALLETQHNTRYGEFGTMCVYPPYASAARLVEKSADPLRYHNGADWPYLSSLYAFAKKMHGMAYRYPLTRWYERGLAQGYATPWEYDSPYYPVGGMLQGWSAFAAFVLDHESAQGFFR